MAQENRYEDVLGFTKQTEILITGLGGTPAVIQEFRKRNISTDELSELTEFDLIRLGVDYNLIPAMLTQLKSVQRKSNEKLTLEHRLTALIDVIESGRNHLDLLSAFIAYSRLRLANEQINFFVEPDKSLRASEALKIGSKAILKEVDEVIKELDCLEKYVTTIDDIPQTKKYVNLSLAVGVLGLTACALVHLFKNCHIRIC